MAVLVKTGDGIRGDVVEPDVYVTGAQDECQTLVATHDGLLHLLLAQAIDDVVDQYAQR